MDKGRIIRIICGVMIAVIAVILIQVFVSDDDPNVNVDMDKTVPYADTANWMGELPDDVYLSEITIPGTHESAARYVMIGYALRCQETSIADQLNNGYRYLDLHIALDKSNTDHTIKLVRAFGNCHESGRLFSGYLHLNDVTTDIYKFLQEHRLSCYPF